MKLSFFCMIASLFALSASEAATKRVALVFDDGPVPEMAPRLLAILQEKSVKATFAQVAKNVETHPETSLAILAAGHEIVNHSYEHRDVDTLDDEELRREIAGAQERMTEVLGVAPKLYWAPYLKLNDRVRAAVSEAGIVPLETSPIVVSMDYDTSVSADEIERRSTTGVQDGAVILFHEWREETVERLPSILDSLKEQGCEFLTFSELAKVRAAMADERG